MGTLEREQHKEFKRVEWTRSENSVRDIEGIAHKCVCVCVCVSARVEAWRIRDERERLTQQASLINNMAMKDEILLDGNFLYFYKNSSPSPSCFPLALLQSSY